MRGRKRSAPAPLGAWTALTDGLLLFLALASTAFGVVTAYRMEILPSALWAGMGAMTPLALLLVRRRRHNVWFFLAALALWAWGVWRLWEPLVWGGARLQCDIVNTIAEKVPNVAQIVPIAELPEEVWPQVATLWLLMVGSIYALVLALLLCRLRRSLPVILWMALPILPALCVTEAPAALPMLGMLAVWLTLALTSLTQGRDPRGTARLRPAALLCAVLALALLAQKLPTQGTAQPLWAADLREAAINEASRGDLSALLTRWSGWVGSGSTKYMNLLGNSAPQTGRVALRVEASQGGKYYLRGYSADVYTGSRWEPLGRAAQRELEAIRDTGVEPLLMLGERAGEASAFRYESYRNGATSVVSGDGAATMTVENVAAPGGCVYYPYGLAKLPENAAFGGDSHLERTGAVWEHTFSFYPKWDRGVDWGLFGGYYDENGESMTEDPYRDFVYAHELQVPEDLRPILETWLRELVVGQMAELMGLREVPEEIFILSPEDFTRYLLAWLEWNTRMWEEYKRDSDDKRLRGWSEEALEELWDEYNRGGPTREDMDRVELAPELIRDCEAVYFNLVLELVTQGLAQTTQYDRDTPAPPAGRDYVDWFLNESQKGYCMHYATAATLLLRTAGIPARYVSGYVTWVPFNGKAEVTDYAAHAWVEVYLDGVGWYPREVTPGYQSSGMGDIFQMEQGDSQPSAAPTASIAPTPTPTASQPPEEEENEEKPTPTPDPTPSQSPQGPTGPGPGAGEGQSIPPGVWYGLGTLLLLALLVWGRKYGIDRRRRKLRGKDTNAAVLYAYACYQRLHSWGGQDSGELTALAEKARFSQHTLTEEERDQAAAIFEAEASRIRQALPGWKRPLFNLLWGR